MHLTGYPLPVMTAFTLIACNRGTRQGIDYECSEWREFIGLNVPAGMTSTLSRVCVWCKGRDQFQVRYISDVMIVQNGAGQLVMPQL